jgi:hypothetical protein
MKILKLLTASRIPKQLLKRSKKDDVKAEKNPKYNKGYSWFSE